MTILTELGAFTFSYLYYKASLEGFFFLVSSQA